MPIASTDFPIGVGGSANDVFPGQAPDDMQEVPLHSSVAPPLHSSAPKASAPASNTAHLHFPPNFPTPCKSCGLAVRVHTPETVSQTTMGIPLTHTVYHVETTSSLSSFPKAQCAVKRRFSDFDALYNALRARYTGYFIPTLPDKTILQGKLLSDKAFLDKRTQDLELFINECCRHEVLQASTVCFSARCRARVSVCAPQHSTRTLGAPTMHPHLHRTEGSTQREAARLRRRTQAHKVNVAPAVQALQLFLAQDTDSLPAHPHWKRAEEEQCVFHSLSVLRRAPAPGLQDSLSSPVPATSTIGKLSSSFLSGVTYLTGKARAPPAHFLRASVTGRRHARMLWKHRCHRPLQCAGEGPDRASCTGWGQRSREPCECRRGAPRRLAGAACMWRGRAASAVGAGDTLAAQPRPRRAGSRRRLPPPVGV
jgi:PX domain